MPYASEKKGIRLLRAYLWRVKLTEKQRQEIKENRLGLSQRAMAQEYGVSRRLITFIQNPEKLEQNKEKRKERGGEAQYYDKEKHKEYMKTHRRHKNKMHKQGYTYELTKGKETTP